MSKRTLIKNKIDDENQSKSSVVPVRVIDNVKKVKELFISDMNREIDLLSTPAILDALNHTLNQTPVLACNYIFNKAVFSRVLTGTIVINGKATGQLNFHKIGALTSEIQSNDIFVRSGQLSAYVKTFFYDDKHLVHHKFTEPNTYSKTFKLGYRLHPEGSSSGSSSARVVYYVKLIEGLQHIRNALIQCREKPVYSSFQSLTAIDIRFQEEQEDCTETSVNVVTPHSSVDQLVTNSAANSMVLTRNNNDGIVNQTNVLGVKRPLSSYTDNDATKLVSSVAESSSSSAVAESISVGKQHA